MMNTTHSEPHYREMMNCVASELREYGIERGLTPQQLSDIFHAGIAAVAENRAVDDPLRIAIMTGAIPA